MTNKITSIPGASSEEKSKTARAIREARESLPLYESHMATMARLHRVKYDALIQEGFTEAQALELCKHIY